MDDESFADDPTYRAGVLMGRQQAVTDIMALLLDPAGGAASEKVMAVMEWCAQALEEGKAELVMVVTGLQSDNN